MTKPAVQYGPAERPVVVRCAATRNGVTITVNDEGAGIEAYHQPSLFERADRAGEGGATTHPWLGMGHVCSREFARQHGGDNWVESEPGTGTTSGFFLPATAKHAPATNGA